MDVIIYIAIVFILLAVASIGYKCLFKDTIEPGVAFITLLFICFWPLGIPVGILTWSSYVCLGKLFNWVNEGKDE